MTEWKTDVEYRTRDGREVRFVGEAPDGTLVFAVAAAGDAWAIGVRHADGRRHPGEDLPSDILPPRRGVWVAVDVETGEPNPGSGASSVEPAKKTRWRVAGLPGRPDVWLEWRFFIEAEPQP